MGHDWSMHLKGKDFCYKCGVVGTPFTKKATCREDEISQIKTETKPQPFDELKRMGNLATSLHEEHRDDLSATGRMILGELDYRIQKLIQKRDGHGAE